jgi:hypothetical protein
VFISFGGIISGLASWEREFTPPVEVRLEFFKELGQNRDFFIVRLL